MNSDYFGDGFQYPPNIDPEVAALLNDTDQLIAQTKEDMAQIAQNQATTGDAGASIFDPIASTRDMCNNMLGEAQDIVDGKYSTEELEALTDRYSAGNNMIKGYNAVETIYNDVADSQRELLDSKNAHHYRMMADGYEISADSHLEKAAEEMRTGGSSWEEFEAAKSDFSQADSYRNWAETYDPQ